MIAEDPYVAHDALELIDVDYEPLPVVISPQAGARGRRAGDPRRQGGPDRQPDLPLGGGRRGGDGEGVRGGRQGRPARDPLPALPPGAARVLRLRRRRQPGDRQGDDLHDLAGAARAPHRVRARRGPARAEHPDHLAGHRRRLRQQGADLSGLRRRDRRVAAARPAGEVDRGPHRQPDLDRLRARLLHGRRAGAEGRRDDDGPAREDALRPGLRLRRRAAVEVQGGPLPHRHRLVRHPGRARRHRGRVHEQGARRRRVPLLVPRHRGVVLHRAARADGGLRARCRPRRAAAAELHPAGEVPVHLGDRLRVRLGQLRAGARPGARARRLQGAARGAEAGARGGPAARHRPRVVHRGRRRRPEPPLRHPRDQDVRLRRAARAPDGEGDPQARRQVAGPGPRDDVRADRRRGARHPARGHHRPGGRHRQHAVRARHVRVALDAGRGRRDRRRGAQGARQGAQARRAPARGVPKTTSSGPARASPSRARPTGRRRSRRSPSPPTPTIPREWRPGSRRRTTTTRRT